MLRGNFSCHRGVIRGPAPGSGEAPTHTIWIHLHPLPGFPSLPVWAGSFSCSGFSGQQQWTGEASCDRDLYCCAKHLRSNKQGTAHRQISSNRTVFPNPDKWIPWIWLGAPPPKQKWRGPVNFGARPDLSRGWRSPASRLTLISNSILDNAIKTIAWPYVVTPDGVAANGTGPCDWSAILKTRNCSASLTCEASGWMGRDGQLKTYRGGKQTEPGHTHRYTHIVITPSLQTKRFFFTPEQNKDLQH